MKHPTKTGNQAEGFEGKGEARHTAPFTPPIALSSMPLLGGPAVAGIVCGYERCRETEAGGVGGGSMTGGI